MSRKSKTVRTLLVVLAMTVLICCILSGCKVTTSNGDTDNIFNVVLVRPFAWFLRVIYDWVQNFGLALLIFCVATRLILLPLNVKSKRSMIEMQAIQPKVKALEKRYANDKNKLQEEQMKLYKEEGINPMSGCLPTLIMLPLMFALYWPISQPLKYIMTLTSGEISSVREALTELGFVINARNGSEMALVQGINEHFSELSHISPNLIQMNVRFLGMNLGEIPSIRVLNGIFFLPIISAVTAFLSMQISNMKQKKNGAAQENNSMQTMTWMMPLLSLWIGYSLPAGLALYWIAGNVVSIGQEYLIDLILKVQGKKAPSKEAKITDGKNSGKKR